jgi:hypothetical protein
MTGTRPPVPPAAPRSRRRRLEDAPVARVLKLPPAARAVRT